ncbi:MAG: GNAT family N-acetyltransferase [Anaerolineaceae bacterium]|nr:GNAT family N-acetyltransferase [Anaerolineaceae bacterium]
MSGAAVELRKAEQMDRAAIWRLIISERLNPLGINWRRFVLAVDEVGAIVGCAQVKPHGDGTRELASLVVVPSWRGRGVSRRLIETLQAAAGPPLYLTCRSGLTDFYTRHGFRVLQDHEMTLYYRRLKRLVRAMVWLTRSREGLAVMRWEGTV